tara:strand:+ start:2453 stop:3727 length:1275 start_codon:yes stop_codon:yes gene_type:complete
MAEFNIDELATVMGGGEGTWQSSHGKVTSLFAAGLIDEETLRDSLGTIFNTTNWGELTDLVKSTKNRAVKMSGGTWQAGYQEKGPDLFPTAGKRVPAEWIMGDLGEGYGGTQNVVIPEEPIIDPITGELKPSYEQLAGLGGTSWSYPKIHGSIVDRPSGVGTSQQYGYAMPNELLGFGGGLLHIPEGRTFEEVYAGHLAGLQSNYQANLDAVAAAANAPPDPVVNPSTPVPYTGPVNALGEPLLDPRTGDWTTGGVASDPSWMWDEWNATYGTNYSNWDDWFGAKSARAMESFPDHSFLLTDPEGNFFEGNPFNDPNMQIWESTHPWQNYTGGNNVAVPFDGSAGFNAGSMGNMALNPWTFDWGSVPNLDGTVQPFTWSPVPGTVGSNTVPMNFDPNASIFARTFNDTIPQGIFDPNTSVFFRT